MKRELYCFMSFVLLATWSVGSAGIGDPAFRLKSQDKNGWVVEYSRQPGPMATIEINNQKYLKLGIGSKLPNEEVEPGAPEIPAETINFGIPFGSSIEVDIVDSKFEYIENQLVAPYPSYTFTEENEAIADYQVSQKFYGQDRFYPDQVVVVDKPFTLRTQRVAPIRLFPYQYNPSRKTLRVLVGGILRIRVVSTLHEDIDLAAPSLGAIDPHFEEVYKGLIWNHEEAKQWRRLTRERSETMVDPTRTWFETGKTYYRMNIGQDGWYRVTPSDLASAGVNPLSIQFSSAKVFGKGVEVPLFIGADSSFGFYARQNYGDSTYIDFFTDTSAYWLTWGGTSGLRFTNSEVIGSPTLTVRSSAVSKHFEKNTAYYTGTTQSDIVENDAVPGEGWVWNFYFPNSMFSYPFTIDSVDRSVSNSTVRVRFFSSTLNYNTPDHRAQLWLNDSLIGDVTFNGRTGITHNATVPNAWLRDGANTLRIQSIPTLSSPNQFYLDWFEVDYQRYLTAESNQLIFTTPNASSGTIGEMTVSGFSTPDIRVFNITSRRIVLGGIVTGDATAGYTITFKDTLSTLKQYVAVSSVGPKFIGAITPKTFADIRVNPAGTDYIILTHRDFFTSAQALATHRANTNGLRTKVIDVQDIYDEFNYGVMNGTKIKAFLQHAYQNWISPAPTYVLMFGDASWDYKRYLPTTIKANFIPAYGIPAGDNWYGCFDPNFPFLPSLLIGRLPVQDPIQAQRTATKMIGYDNYTLSEWNKNFMMITGGNNPSEQAGFNFLTEGLINTHILPPSIGGTPFRVYKATTGVIDGENKQLMKDLFKRGLSFVNFLGHSGGRIWGVDIGNPSDLENTDGKLPFVSSVSCNVGAFAEPSNNVLAEDFVLADNRGAIAAWASSSLGYANFGASLVNNFLSGLRVDSLRGFGALTTTARYKLWQASGSGYITVAMVKLNPLIGDPLTRYALPLKPDLAVTTDFLSTNVQTPTPLDSAVTLRLNIANYGLVPPDSVGITLSDWYNGQVRYLLYDQKLRRTNHRDSLTLQWRGTDKVGRHVLAASLDPSNVINEVTKINNNASKDMYVFANQLAVVKPINNAVTVSGPQRLVVSSPVGRDSIGFHYVFQLDTVPSFDSPALVSSGSISPAPVSGEWTTPSLIEGKAYFWRARTVEGELLGNWVTSSFSTSSDLPIPPKIRWRENSKHQFARNQMFQSVATDSGVTIASNPPVALYARSLGYRANANLDFYSLIKINDQIITGYWWEIGASFMVVRLNEFTGGYEFRAFAVSSVAAQADSMRRFINNTPAGNFIVISVILDGKTNVSESLYVAIESLGSTRIRQVQPGQSWALIGRKGTSGPGMTALEGLTNDSVVVSLQVPNYYSLAKGGITTTAIPIPVKWDSLHWRPQFIAGKTDARLAILGIQPNGVVDTLRILGKDTTDISLGFLDTLTAGPRYSTAKLATLFSNADALFTPVLKDWWLDFEPPADLAISPRTIGSPVEQIASGTPINLAVTVHNIGYRRSDSSRVFVSSYDKYNVARLITSVVVDSIPVGGSRTVVVPLSTVNFSRRVTLLAQVAPTNKGKDLVAENNSAFYFYEIIGLSRPSDVRVFANGVEVMDGDYISARPRLEAKVNTSEEELTSFRQVELFVGNKKLFSENAAVLEKGSGGGQKQNGETVFNPSLSNGRHDFTFKVSKVDAFGNVDTLERVISLNVLNESRVLNVYNYPNPFARETFFTFTLTGSQIPQEVIIRVLTIAGRKVKEFAVPQGELQIGFNRVLWDGRDNDGDELANGYYLYQVLMKGDGVSDSAIQKLVKMK